MYSTCFLLPMWPNLVRIGTSPIRNESPGPSTTCKPYVGVIAT